MLGSGAGQEIAGGGRRQQLVDALDGDHVVRRDAGLGLDGAAATVDCDPVVAGPRLASTGAPPIGGRTSATGGTGAGSVTGGSVTGGTGAGSVTGGSGSGSVTGGSVSGGSVAVTATSTSGSGTTSTGSGTATETEPPSGRVAIVTGRATSGGAVGDAAVVAAPATAARGEDGGSAAAANGVEGVDVDEGAVVAIGAVVASCGVGANSALPVVAAVRSSPSGGFAERTTPSVWPLGGSDPTASPGAAIAGGAAKAAGSAEGSVVAATKRLVAAVSGATGASSKVARRARSPRPTIWLRPIVAKTAGGGSVRSRWLTRRSWSRAWAHSAHSARCRGDSSFLAGLAVLRTIWASAWRASRHSRGMGPRPAVSPRCAW